MNKVLQWMGTATLMMAAGQISNAAGPDKATPVADSVELQAEVTQLNEFEAVSDSVDDSNSAVGGQLMPFKSMRQRLADPAQRAAFRAEQRESLGELHVDAEEVLGINAATREKLLDLLVDKQLKSFDSMGLLDLTAEADIQNQHLRALRDLLGEDAFDRFQSYQLTLSDRRYVNLFDTRLGPADKLQRVQKEKLITLWAAYQRALRDSPRSPTFTTEWLQRMPSAEEARRDSQLRTIAINEEIWRRMPAADRRLAEQAATFLNPVQLTELQRWQAEESGRLQQWIEKARTQAGLSPTIPAKSDIPSVSSPPTRKPVPGKVKLDLDVTVNRSEPVKLSHVGANGASVMFEAGDGLFIEATPTLYDDDWLELQTTYYERDRNGKRRRLSSGGFSAPMRTPDGTVSRGGGGKTIVTGSKAYAVSHTAISVEEQG